MVCVAFKTYQRSRLFLQNEIAIQEFAKSEEKTLKMINIKIGSPKFYCKEITNENTKEAKVRVTFR